MLFRRNGSVSVPVPVKGLWEGSAAGSAMSAGAAEDAGMEVRPAPVGGAGLKTCRRRPGGVLGQGS